MKRSAKNSSTFCIVPWTQIATNSSGYYRVCCNSVPGKNLIRDAENNPMKIYKKTAAEAWNSETYKELREQLLSSVRPEMCERCFREEDSGVKSARQRWNEGMTQDEFEADPELNIKYIDLRLGNLCNLKCRMCNPYASSKWVDEWNSIIDKAELVPNNALNQNEIKRLKKLDWPRNEQTWKNLAPVLDTIEEIYLTGGEPFLSLEQRVLLNHLIEGGKAKKIKLKYNTNLTILPKELTELWKHFKKVQLNVSLDGVGHLNSYIRHPSKWSDIETHLNKLSSMKEEYGNLNVGIHITVQAYNILKLDEIYNYFSNDLGMKPYLNILNHPKCLNIRVLPKPLVDFVVQKLTPLRDNKDIAEVINYITAESWFDDSFEDFIQYTIKLDKNRKESLVHLVEEFKDYFEGKS